MSHRIDKEYGQGSMNVSVCMDLDITPNEFKVKINVDVSQYDEPSTWDYSCEATATQVA